MCGFFSIHSNKDFLRNPEYLITSAKNILKRRGPNSQNAISLDRDFTIKEEINNTKNILIGARLNIIDDSNLSNMPFISNCKRYVLLYNGEIYNFKTLRNKYLKNFDLKTNSDTEVLLYLLIQQGERILNELNGMFAINFYDLSNKKILLARDKLGIKPLYYLNDNQIFSLSSDLKILFETNKHNIKINNNLALLYLNNLSNDHKVETFFKKIFKIEPGKYLIFDMQNFIIERYEKYWSIPKNVPKINRTNKEVRNDLFNAVENHTLNNRDFVINLSGGIDSSILLSIFRELYPNRNLKVYSFNFGKNSDLSEKYYSDLVAQKFNAEKTNVELSLNDYFNGIMDTNYALSAPSYGFSNVAQNLLYKKISEDNIKVSFDGQGADEIFGGYQGYGVSLMKSNFNKLNINGFIKNLFYLFKNKNLDHRFVLNFLSRFLSNDLYKFFLNFTEKSLPKTIINYDKNIYSDYVDIFFQEKKIHQKDIFLNEILFFLTRGLESLLNSLDANSMHYAVEARVPYLDNNIIDKYVNIDDEQRVTNKFEFKKILRDSFKHNLPEKVYNRNDKIGFATDDEFLMRVNIDRMISDVKNFNENKLINKSKFIDILKKFKKNKNTDTKLIYKMYSFSLWTNQFNVYE